MKNFTFRLMVIAAALSAAAGSALAQTHTYTASVPYAFQAGKTQMQPGSYEFKMEPQGGNSILTVSNLDTAKKIYLLPSAGTDAPAASTSAKQPVVAFVCGGGQCALRSLWDGHSASIYRFAPPKPVRGTHFLSTLIPLKPAD
jgi:hypothetical protein